MSRTFLFIVPIINPACLKLHHTHFLVSLLSVLCRLVKKRTITHLLYEHQASVTVSKLENFTILRNICGSRNQGIVARTEDHVNTDGRLATAPVVLRLACDQISDNTTLPKHRFLCPYQLISYSKNRTLRVSCCYLDFHTSCEIRRNVFSKCIWFIPVRNMNTFKKYTERHDFVLLFFRALEDKTSRFKKI